MTIHISSDRFKEMLYSSGVVFILVKPIPVTIKIRINNNKRQTLHGDAGRAFVFLPRYFENTKAEYEGLEPRIPTLLADDLSVVSLLSCVKFKFETYIPALSISIRQLNKC